MSQALLIQAIRDRQVVEFRYGAEHRTVEPYRLGEAGGRPRLTGWQSRKGWRSFFLDEMTDLALLPRFFVDPREGYTRGDPTMDRILAQV